MKYRDAGSTFHSENTCKFILSAQMGDDGHSFILENRGVNIVKMDESHYRKENGEDGSIQFSEMRNLNKECFKDVQKQIRTCVTCRSTCRPTAYTSSFIRMR